jgi:sarcosine oxidase subunit beta
VVPDDGTIRPLAILGGYLGDASGAGCACGGGRASRGRARRHGARDARAHERRGVSPGIVVNAAGPWAGALAALAGVDLPVAPVRRQVAVADPAPGAPLDDGFPMTIWTSDVFHLRVRDGRALLNWPVDTPPPGDDPSDLTLYRPWVADVWARARARVPALRDGRLDDSAHWVGLYEMSPDKTIVLGVAPGCPNMVLANGSSDTA